jgi:hypothetical protein
VLAPALIVFTLDTLTIDPTATAGIEALTRLVVGLAGAVVVAVVLSVFHRQVIWRFWPRKLKAKAERTEPQQVKAAEVTAAAENVRVEPTLSPTPPKRPSQGAPLRKRPQRPA